LALALAYATGGFRTVGFDIDESKTVAINGGQSYIHHLEAATIRTHVDSGKLTATCDFSELVTVDAIILCVPTPLDSHFEPDPSHVISTIEAIIPFLRNGRTISLESTTYPGTTEELVSRIEAAGIGKGAELVTTGTNELGSSPSSSLIQFVVDRPGHDQRYAINSKKIQDELDWAPQEQAVTSLNKTVQWYMQNRDWRISILDGSYRVERLERGT